ncbi:MAG: aminotransferase class V-fold PLP-dependent enzyme [Armatimonadetes bacterium]|nr:aminotransferase class V-fold PLP-dependent enzyme [Armatimonadota bacterium]
MILLTPGPCMTSEAVRQAAACEDLNHRDPAFLELIGVIRGHLRDLSGGMIPTLISGSGSMAMEAMATSLVARGPVLILADGYYSERMADIFAIHGIPAKVLSFDWMSGWDLDQVRSALDEAEYEWVAACHHETTTGRLNPVGELADLVHQTGAKLMVDAMSSLGADEVPFAKLDAVVASANKCLHGLPGVGFVLTRDPVPVLQKPRTYTLDLSRYQGELPPMTAPVPTLRAFRQALREFVARGGQAGRHREYSEKKQIMLHGLTAKGYPLALEESQQSVTLIMAGLPKPYPVWFRENYEKGFVIYGCKGELADRFFQVSPMGESTPEMISAWVDSLPRFA